MSRRNKDGWRGAWLALLLGAFGCGGPLEEETPPGVQEEQEAPEVQAQHGTPGASRCEPARQVKNSPVVNPFVYFSPVLTPLKGWVYFVAPTSEGGPTALWRANADEGARPLIENVSGPLLKAGDRVYFAHDDALWVTNGTTRGTRRLVGLAGSSLGGSFADVRGRLFFSVALPEAPGIHLWVSDGTPGGTRRLAAFPAFPFVLSQFTEFRGRLFFVGWDPAHGLEPWTSDGTPGGTRLFKDIAPGTASSNPSQLTVVDGSLYFVADDQVHGEEPWTVRSLDPSRTFLVRDFVPGPSTSYSRLLAGLHGDLFLTIHPADEFNDLELWRTDGWPHATMRVKRFASPNPLFTELWTSSEAAVADGLLYFIIQPLSTTGPGAGNAQLWRTDGTTKGTRYLTEPLTYGDQGPIPELFAVDDSVLFAALENVPLEDPRQHGRELWKTEGTASSTRLLQDLLPGPRWSDPSAFVRAGRFVYFVAWDAANLPHLWALPVGSVRCAGPL